MGVDVFDQAVSVLLHLEEICVFLRLVHFTSADRAVIAVHYLGSCIESLALSAIEAVILAQIDVALVIELFEDLLHLALMVLIRRADKAVVRCVDEIPKSLDLSGHIIDKFLGCLARDRSSGLDLLAVLITSCLEVHVIAVRPFISGDTVRQNDLIGISDMRLAGSVGDRCCDVILSFILHRFKFPLSLSIWLRSSL